tara:strand:- start:1370 stop:1813 length:444 start_codon:yes stop_codon:yes gene_type:complete
MGVLSAMGLPLWRKRAQQCQSHDLVSPELSGSYTAAFVKCTSGKSILVLASQLASVDCQNLFVKYLGAIGQHQGVELNLESELQSNLDEADGMIVFGDCFTVKLQLNKQQVHASKPCLALASVAFMFENPDYKRQCWQLTKVLLQGV